MAGINGMIRTKEHNDKIREALKKHKRTKEHQDKITKSLKIAFANPKDNPNYRGDGVGYMGIHRWLVNNFGLADKCEKCEVTGFKGKKWNICYALKHSCRYERKRENFIKLCHKCHRNYDKTEEWGKNISKSKLIK